MAPLREKARIVRANYMCGSFPLELAINTIEMYCAARRVSIMTIGLADRRELLIRREEYDNGRASFGELGRALFEGAPLDQAQSDLAGHIARRAKIENDRGRKAWKQFQAISVPARD